MTEHSAGSILNQYDPVLQHAVSLNTDKPSTELDGGSETQHPGSRYGTSESDTMPMKRSTRGCPKNLSISSSTTMGADTSNESNSSAKQKESPRTEQLKHNLQRTNNLK